MDLYVKEYSWMWERLGLSLAECRIYGYIYGLTTSNRTEQKGYKGSERALAEKLGLSRTSVNDTLRLLQQKNLITCVNKVYYSVNSADNSVNSADKSVHSADSPIPPIIKEINKEMENKEKQQCARAHACGQHSGVFMMFSFEAFKSAFVGAGGDHSELQRRETACINEWQAMSEAKRQAIFKMLKSRADGENSDHWKPNPLFLLRDFPEPQPTNYNGYSFPTGAQMVIAIYNGKGGIYTKADAELYNMTIKKELEP